MRFFNLTILGCVLLLSLLPVLSQADSSTVVGLGNASLVLEDEITKLTIYNMGNPAGIIFQPRDNRLDLSLQFGHDEKLEEFTTHYADDTMGTFLLPESKIHYDWDPSTPNTYESATQTTTTRYYYYYNVDSKGNTLLPDTIYSWRTTRTFLGLLPLKQSLYQGVLAWPTENLGIQFIPQVSYQKVVSNDSDRLSPTSWQNGGTIRCAYEVFKNASLGVGLTGTQSVWNYSGREDQSRFTGLQAGLGYRLVEVFDPEDRLTLGLSFEGALENQSTHAHDLSTLDFPQVSSYTQLNRPVRSAFQGVYHYKKVMDVGLNLAYKYDDNTLAWSGRDYVASALRNVDYELEFRVRLPMVREDDLRFGVTFNNQSFDHPYPNGSLELLDTSTLGFQDPITTFTSGIGIGTAIVPSEGSIFSLEYRLGSSKSRQANMEETLADSGYALFSFGVQYQLLPGLFLRTSYVDQRVAYESYEKILAHQIITQKDPSGVETILVDKYYTAGENLLTYSTYTRSFRFGVGVEKGPWKINLTGNYSKITHSPEGWDIPEKPIALDKVNKDKSENLSGMLSLTWMY
ncbi:hypothetical protein KAR34_05250 [bacterium]|nr:hypothetical protein [bacterium]